MTGLRTRHSPPPNQQREYKKDLMMSIYQDANSAPLFENGSSLDSEHLDSEELASSEGFYELHEEGVSLKTEEPGPRQSEAAIGEHESATVKDKVAKLLKGKEREWEAVVKKDRPLQLLDLPVDVLKEIIKEVSMASKDATPLIILTFATGYAHQRPHFSGAHSLRLTQSCYTLHLFEVRYCLARGSQYVRTSDGRRCPHLWPGYTGDGGGGVRGRTVAKS